MQVITIQDFDINKISFDVIENTKYEDFKGLCNITFDKIFIKYNNRNLRLHTPSLYTYGVNTKFDTPTIGLSINSNDEDVKLLSNILKQIYDKCNEHLKTIKINREMTNFIKEYNGSKSVNIKINPVCRIMDKDEKRLRKDDLNKCNVSCVININSIFINKKYCTLQMDASRIIKMNK